ncbi:hypothetical protein BRE01_02530 [Brevibacillus reuszeri]|uniref:Uncharacterized protein n=1 Tax=Brevibacillus reuszeri TaxID=54915 RepID=A0A0K9YR31_9BACL|nr:hypothetical protein [Brevibacillus reuszeri]KNB71183.1 hypothetical protein ADS79_20430 [Brevibacillus reuszeri]MED1857616.1 hypothetical protein [Brevibacillus reuszeri]GED66551.1 hypothetical protein BRE01_02530 [Brevibacillus reuszeri]
MEFSFDMSLLLLALGVSGYLVAHLFSGPGKPLVLRVPLPYELACPDHDNGAIRLSGRPRILFVRRKAPPKEYSRSLDDAEPLFFLYCF